MIDQPSPPVQAAVPLAQDEASAAVPVVDQRDVGRVVIDLLQLVPPPPLPVCEPDEPDPFNAVIVVCHVSEVSQRLGPVVGPEDDGFASAIPRARVQLSDKAAAEANATNPSVGGWNAQGAELRLKIDF